MSTKIQVKQTDLTAGTNISIVGNTISATGGSGDPHTYDLGGFFLPLPTASQKIISTIVPRDVTVYVNNPGVSQSTVAATASTTYTIKVEGSSVGTIVYTAAATEGTVTWTGSASISAGDELSIEAPATPDVTHAGISIELRAELTSTENAYDIAGFFEDKPTSSEVIFSFIAPRDIEIDDTTEGYADSDVAATASTTLDIEVDGTDVGDIVFSASGTTGAFTWAGEKTISKGQVIQIVGPASADATLEDIRISLRATELGSHTARDIGFYYPIVPLDGSILFAHAFARDTILKLDDPGQAESDTAATASTTYTLKVDNQTVGTVVWAVSGTVGTIRWTGDALIRAGSLLTLTAPSTADTTHKEFSIEFRMEELTAAELAVLEEAARQDGRWARIASSKYTALPTSTSTVTFANTEDFTVGTPIRWTTSADTRYAIVTAVTTDSLVTIAGAPLALGTAIQDLRAGVPEQAVVLRLFVASTYGDGTGDILAADNKQYVEWDHGTAYLVAAKARHDTDDTTTEPVVNIKVAGTAVLTTGITVDAADWVESGAVAIDKDEYDIARGDALELNVSTAGGTGDASDLSFQATFVLE